MTVIDPITYSSNEIKSKQGVPIFIRQAFDLEVFQNIGFPIRVNNFLALRPLIDTMQEGRFRGYVEELGGFSVSDVEILRVAIRSHLIFQKKYFPQPSTILPLDTMASGLLASKKLSCFVGSTENILEIGPGVCSTAFFLDKYIKQLKSVAYVEACPSFYILQSMLLEHLYNANFLEHAHEKNDAMIDWVDLGISLPREALGTSLNSGVYNSKSEGISVGHYPWFKIPSLVKTNFKYDLILANACLNEISKPALNIYLELITKNILRMGGYLFYQCPGLNHDGRDIVGILGTFGFKLIFASGINSEFHLGDGDSLKWKTPTPTALFQYVGEKITINGDESMNISRGLLPYCGQESLEALRLIKSDQVNNLIYETIIEMLYQELS